MFFFFIFFRFPLDWSSSPTHYGIKVGTTSILKKLITGYRDSVPTDCQRLKNIGLMDRLGDFYSGNVEEVLRNAGFSVINGGEKSNGGGGKFDGLLGIKGSWCGKTGTKRGAPNETRVSLVCINLGQGGEEQARKKNCRANLRHRKFVRFREGRRERDQQG